MKNFIYNWLNCAFEKEVAENPTGFVIIVIATYLAMC